MEVAGSEARMCVCALVVWKSEQTKTIYRPPHTNFSPTTFTHWPACHLAPAPLPISRRRCRLFRRLFRRQPLQLQLHEEVSTAVLVLRRVGRLRCIKGRARRSVNECVCVRCRARWACCTGAGKQRRARVEAAQKAVRTALRLALLGLRRRCT